MRLIVNNCWTQVVAASEDELEWLVNYLSVAQTVYSAYEGASTKQVCAFNPRRQRFPSGLARAVHTRAMEDSITCEVQDIRTRPSQLDESKIPDWLRDYQREAIIAAAKRTRGMIVAPTGSGKGTIAVALTQCIPCNWLFLCHRTDVVDMFAKRYESLTGETAGVWEGSHKAGSANLSVATFQSIYRALRLKDKKVRAFLDGITGILIDEAHSASADTYGYVLSNIHNAYYRIGFSGTPLDRSAAENMQVVGAVGQVIYSIQTQTLIEAGVLSRPTIRMINCDQKSVAGDTWIKVYTNGIVRSIQRNKLIAQIAFSADKPCLLFVDQTKHLHQLMPYLTATGMRVEAAYGTHSTEYRNDRIRSLVKGHSDVLVCTSIFQEGVDVPSLTSVILASGKSSVVATIQRMGRGMRTDATTGKTTFELFDIMDKGHRWLEKHSIERLKAYQAQGHDVYIGDLEGGSDGSR